MVKGISLKFVFCVKLYLFFILSFLITYDLNIVSNICTGLYLIMCINVTIPAVILATSLLKTFIPVKLKEMIKGSL